MPAEVERRGQWWRFDAYEVRAGYIQPAEGARLIRYDPWETHAGALARPGRRDLKGANRTYVTPYTSLIEAAAPLLSAQFGGLTVDGRIPDEGAEGRLVEWLNAYGLLGIGPHCAEVITMPTRKTLFAGQQVAQAVQFQRLPDGRWLQRSLGFPVRERDAAWTRLDLGEVVPRRLLAAETPWPPGPGVVVRDPGTAFGAQILRTQAPEVLSFATLAESWGRFFPGVPEDRREVYAYPVPLSEEFWRAYAEPVDEFLLWVRTLGASLKGTTELDELIDGAPVDDPAWIPLGGLNGLRQLVARASPSLERSEQGDLVQVWRAPSLLCTLATMALTDIDEDRPVHSCKGCGRLFVSRAHQAEYCSARCRHREQKRAQRARERSAVELHGQGATPQQIADTLATRPETVAGWIKRSESKQRRGQQ